MELLKHQPPLSPQSQGQAEHEIAGLLENTSLDNYISDLEDLAYQVYRYSDLRDRDEDSDLEGTPSELPALLQRITNKVKNLAILYTDCLSEAFNQFIETQREVKAQLNQYPEEIAGLQRQILKADQQIRQLSESVAIFTVAIDRQIAFDSSLKNDAQRKALRAALMESDHNYSTASTALKAAQDHREELLIKLQFLRNRFSVLKLHMRETIVRQELAAIDAA